MKITPSDTLTYRELITHMARLSGQTRGEVLRAAEAAGEGHDGTPVLPLLTSFVSRMTRTLQQAVAGQPDSGGRYRVSVRVLDTDSEVSVMTFLTDDLGSARRQFAATVRKPVSLEHDSVVSEVSTLVDTSDGTVIAIAEIIEQPTPRED